MSDIKSILAELDDIFEQAKAVKSRMSECEAEMRELRNAVRRSARGVAEGEPGRHAEVLLYIVKNEQAFALADLSLTDLELAIGRSRKSVRLSIEWLKRAKMVERDGRRMTVTALGRAVAEGL